MCVLILAWCLGSMCVLILYWSWAAYTGYVELEQPAYSDEVRTKEKPCNYKVISALIVLGEGAKVFIQQKSSEF